MRWEEKKVIGNARLKWESKRVPVFDQENETCRLVAVFPMSLSPFPISAPPVQLEIAAAFLLTSGKL